MRRFPLAVSFALFCILSILALQPLPAGTGDETIDVQVSPQTILLNWKARGEVKVTVHTDVSFGLFDDPHYEVDVTLGGVPAYYIKADARGDLVAKFDFYAVKGLLTAGVATLTLTAVDEDGAIHIGSDEVRVVGD